MVSYSNIPSTLLVFSLLLFLSPPFIHKPQNLVAADYRLILAECSKSDNPTTCINSLKSNLDAPNDDKTGTATKLVESINGHGHQLVTNMRSLASKTKDQALKGVYQDCINKYYKTNKNLLASAIQALYSHKYKDAYDFVAKAFQLSNECHHNIEIHISEVPYDVITKEIILYEKLSQDALAIIQGLQ